MQALTLRPDCLDWMVLMTSNQVQSQSDGCDDWKSAHDDVSCNSVTQCSTGSFLVELGSEASIKANAGEVINQQIHIRPEHFNNDSRAFLKNMH